MHIYFFRGNILIFKNGVKLAQVNVLAFVTELHISIHRQRRKQNVKNEFRMFFYTFLAQLTARLFFSFSCAFLQKVTITFFYHVTANKQKQQNVLICISNIITAHDTQNNLVSLGRFSFQKIKIRTKK